MLALLFAIPALQRQLTSLLEQLPRFLDWIDQTAIPWLTDTFDHASRHVCPCPPPASGCRSIGRRRATYVAQGLGTLVSSGFGLIGVLVNVVVVPVVTFYLLATGTIW